MDILIQQFVNALSLGGTYALLALGLAMVFSVLGLINFAHGDLMTLTGYTMFFAIGAGLGLPLVPDAEARRAACRAFNTFSADYFGPFSDRMTPSAVIPMHTPEEAIEELEYAVRQLGLKVVMLGSLIARPIEAVAEKTPEAAEVAAWLDVLVLDSVYD